MRHMDAMDLGTARVRLRTIYDGAHAPNPAVVEGEAQCWRCPAYHRCPAKVSLALAYSQGIDPRTMPTLELTDEAVARGWVALRAAKKLLGEVERIYRGYASDHPVSLGGGKMLGEVVGTREALDGDVAFRVLTEKYGPGVAAIGVTHEASKASVKRAMASIAQKGAKAALVREALAAIEAADGVTVKATRTVEEYKAEVAP